MTQIGSYTFTDDMVVSPDPGHELRARKAVVGCLDYLAAHPGTPHVTFAAEFPDEVLPQDQAAIDLDVAMLTAAGWPADPPSGAAYAAAIRCALWIAAHGWAAYTAQPNAWKA